MRNHSAGDPPLAPAVSVALGNHVKVQGHSLLSPDLMTEAEIDVQIDSLVQDLQAMRAAAKSELRRLQAAMLK
jgi:hypothetical protein